MFAIPAMEPFQLDKQGVRRDGRRRSREQFPGSNP
jgi:hypothetical protein